MKSKWTVYFFVAPLLGSVSLVAVILLAAWLDLGAISIAFVTGITLAVLDIYIRNLASKTEDGKQELEVKKNNMRQLVQNHFLVLEKSIEIATIRNEYGILKKDQSSLAIRYFLKNMRFQASFLFPKKAAIEFVRAEVQKIKNRRVR